MPTNKSNKVNKEESKKEIRMLAERLEVRADESDNNKMLVEGYAVVFDSPATHGFTEIIDKHAFDKCDMSDVPLRYNHTENFLILARTRNKSLELVVDEKGLKIKAELLDTTQGRDIYKCLKVGLLDKMSFAFTVSEEKWDAQTDTRTILKIDKLYDVSVVDTPFYDTTSIYARALSTLESEKKKLDNLKEQQRKELRKELRKKVLLIKTQTLRRK